MQRLSERASRDAGGEQLGLDGVAERAPADELLALSNWAGRTETGDRAELDVEPSAVAWSAVSVSARECRDLNWLVVMHLLGLVALQDRKSTRLNSSH